MNVQVQHVAAALDALPIADQQEDSSLSAAAQYVLALVQQTWLAHGSDSTIPLSLLHGSGIPRAQIRTQMADCIDKLRQLRSQVQVQPHQQDWTEADPRFQHASISLHCMSAMPVRPQPRWQCTSYGSWRQPSASLAADAQTCGSFNARQQRSATR